VTEDNGFEVDIQPNSIIFCALPHQFVDIANLRWINDSTLLATMTLDLSYRWFFKGSVIVIGSGELFLLYFLVSLLIGGLWAKGRIREGL